MKEDEYREKYNPNRDSGIGDIKNPPSFNLITENIYIKEININKINDFAELYSVNNISDCSAGNQCH